MPSDAGQHERPVPRSGLIGGLLGDERVRFILVGGFNTAFGYGLFVLFELLLGPRVSYFVSLYGSFIIATVVAFFLHRNVTYRVRGTGNVLIDFLRFMSVYLLSLGINSIALPLLVEVFGVRVLPAQALIVIVTTLVSYFGHKFFSFRRAPGKRQVSGPAVSENDGPREEDQPGQAKAE